MLLVCLIFSGSRYAQQAKAYELLHYVSESDGQTFLLAYADGYPAASSIKIKRSFRITAIFQPVNGTADDDGDLIFTASKNKQGGQIILHGVDQNYTAPAVLKATYALKGWRLRLIFKKSKVQ
ncbi:hypothetical protein [Mucilaginibacter auburnensis]|nr:hypothetical protein [Mucilaginibacter auburnensis]